MLKSLFLKRLFDAIVGTILLILTLPVMAISALVLWFKLGRPIFFPQTRPGYRGKPFTIYKFRTMADKRDAKGDLLPDAERMTAFGNILRKLSIDELPELWNVVKGDMSLVGPRPLLMEYLPLYTPEQAKRMDVLPGITGLAQVNGRNDTAWEERFKYDLLYIQQRNFFLDLRILFMTVFQVVKREGVTAKEHVTMPRFQGKPTSDPR